MQVSVGHSSAITAFPKHPPLPAWPPMHCLVRVRMPNPTLIHETEQVDQDAEARVRCYKFFRILKV